MNESIAYVGLDVHKDTIAVAVAYAGREPPVYCGVIAPTDKAVSKLIERLSAKVEELRVCYETGPRGYGLPPGGGAGVVL